MENLGIKITNSDKYTGADVSGIKYKNGFGAYVGDVEIEINGEQITFSGEHGAFDYEDEYGFIIQSIEQ